MTPKADPLAELHDIEGLDPIGWWPPAIGWWVAAAAVLLIIAGIVVILRRKRAFERSWRNNALKILSEMEFHTSAAETAVELSELIRRIALSRYSRKACAGLEGEAWLSWLAEHDPKQFNWLEEAPWLITLPYAPPGSSVPKAEIERAIQAMKRWVR